MNEDKLNRFNKLKNSINIKFAGKDEVVDSDTHITQFVSWKHA